jgi:hypothetical protein
MSIQKNVAGKILRFTDPKQPIRVVTVRMEKPLHEKLSAKANAEHRSINDLCIELLESATRDEEPGDPSDWDANFGQPVH